MTDVTSKPAKRRHKIAQTDIPSYTLLDSARVPRAIADNYGSAPTRPIDVASALNMTPSSGGFRNLCGASIGYGLTTGGPNASEIALADLGQRLVSPLEENEDLLALREAAKTPTIASSFYSKYDGSPLPPQNIAQNVLASLGVPPDRTERIFQILMTNAEDVGFIKTIKDKQYLDLGASSLAKVTRETTKGSDETDPASDLENEAENSTNNESSSSADVSRENSTHKNAIFIAHGSNQRPMEQLKQILSEYRIPYKHATMEANRARPIPTKVADTMRECGAAILVFTADREYFDKDGNPIWLSSENVSHELGAASVLYGERIVIFKEKGISLPSNFSSIGYIEFEKDQLNDKGIDLFRELVSMKILSISVAGN